MEVADPTAARSQQSTQRAFAALQTLAKCFSNGVTTITIVVRTASYAAIKNRPLNRPKSQIRGVQSKGQVTHYRGNPISIKYEH